MKCKKSDCKNCVHFINIRTHPLFADFAIKSEDGRMIEFEGCVFHLQTMFLRQIWVRTMGVQSAAEGVRNHVSKSIQQLALNIEQAVKQQRHLKEKEISDGKSDSEIITVGRSQSADR